MRLILISCLVLGVTGVAGAHTLPGDANLPSQLGHQLLGPHHLLLTAILLFAGTVLYRFLRKSAQRANRYRQ